MRNLFLNICDELFSARSANYPYCASLCKCVCLCACPDPGDTTPPRSAEKQKVMQQQQKKVGGKLYKCFRFTFVITRKTFPIPAGSGGDPVALVGREMIKFLLLFQFGAKQTTSDAIWCRKGDTESAICAVFRTFLTHLRYMRQNTKVLPKFFSISNSITKFGELV